MPGGAQCRLDSCTPVGVTPVWFVRARACVCVYVYMSAMYVFDNIVYDAGDDGRSTPGRGHNIPAHP